MLCLNLGDDIMRLNQPFDPMVLVKSDSIPKGDYLHQFKWDGHRGLLHYDNGTNRLYTREMNLIGNYPEINSLKLTAKNCILDGECIVLSNESNPPLPCFESIMTRFHTTKTMKVKSLLNTLPVHFVVWDILYLNDEPLVRLPLYKRLEILKNLIIPDQRISITPSFEDGEALFKQVVAIGAEGVVSKPKDGIYTFGTSSGRNAWYKIKNYQYAIVEINGFKKKDFGWSLSIDGKYVGVLEFPPPKKQIFEFYSVAKQLIKRENENWIYIEPILKCKVKFQCYSRDGKLRSPSFVEYINLGVGDKE
jgi:ATP-dependent DNA ligase